MRSCCSIMAFGVLLLLSDHATAAFEPPRIVGVINQSDSGSRSAAELADRRYVIDKGQIHQVNRGDVMNVDRENKRSQRIPVPLRMFIGTMTITDAQHQSSIGIFEANPMVMSQITDYLVAQYAFITGAMVEAKGYGEVQSIVPNDTPENKALNRRIEVIVWE